MTEWSQGIGPDGPVILKDGRQAHIDEISAALATSQTPCRDMGFDDIDAISAAALSAVRDELAKLVEFYMHREKPGHTKMMLAIAARDVRRGRRLTQDEQVENLLNGMRERDEGLEEGSLGRNT